MKALVTGSTGHLGEALVRTLTGAGHDVVGADILPSPWTTRQGSVADPAFVRSCMDGVEIIFHAATLHKPHVGTHSNQEFIDTNITGTLNLLEAAVEAGIKNFIFTSTTSTFGDALVPDQGLPAAWITEEVTPIPKNIYGATKTAAEDLCQLFFRNHGLNCLILRTSRFFPEEDDNKKMRSGWSDDNMKANEYLFRRVDLEDAVSAHLAAAEKIGEIGFGKYIISATTPFTPGDLPLLRTDAPAVLRRLYPDFETLYARRGWRMFLELDRVYVNEKARRELGWQPKYDFRSILDRLASGAEDLRTPMTRTVGAKGYHAQKFAGHDGPYPM